MKVEIAVAYCLLTLIIKCVTLTLATWVFTDRCSVLLGESGHGWQGARAQGKSVKHATMNTQCLVFPKHTMGTQLGQPDVEELVVLCLTGRWERKQQQHTKIEKEQQAESNTSSLHCILKNIHEHVICVVNHFANTSWDRKSLWIVLCRLPWGGTGCLQHPGLCVWISCWQTWQPGWRPDSHGVSLSESKTQPQSRFI